MKNAVSLLLAFLICLSMAGCAGSAETGETGTDASAATTAPREEPEVLLPDEEALHPVFPTDLLEYHHYESKYFDNGREQITVEYKRFAAAIVAQAAIRTDSGLAFALANYSKYDENGNCILSYSCTGSIAKLIKREFENGKKTVEYEYGALSGVSTDWIVSMSVPSVDESRMFLTCKTLFEDGKEVRKITYSSEGEESLIEEFEYSGNQKLWYRYAPGEERQLYQTKTISSEAERDPSQKVVYDEYGNIAEEYNDDGQLVRRYDYYHSQDVDQRLIITLTATYEYTYRPDGLPAQMKKIWPAESHHASTVTDYIYSANNYLIYEKTYGEDTPTTLETETVYQYDADGNKIVSAYYSAEEKIFLQ